MYFMNYRTLELKEPLVSVLELALMAIMRQKLPRSWIRPTLLMIFQVILASPRRKGTVSELQERSIREFLLRLFLLYRIQKCLDLVLTRLELSLISLNKRSSKLGSKIAMSSVRVYFMVIVCSFELSLISGAWILSR